MAINTYLSILTLNVNGLYVPVERHRVAEWIKKKQHTYLENDPYAYFASLLEMFCRYQLNAFDLVCCLIQLYPY